MPIWSAEIKEIETILGSLKDQKTALQKEIARLIKENEETIVLIY